MREEVERLEHHADVAAQPGQLPCPPRAAAAPSMAISPESIGSSRLIVRQSVDLPEPDGPMTTTTSPRAISRSMSCRTCSSPNHLLTPDRRTRGSPFELVTRSTLGGRQTPLATGPITKAVTDRTRSCEFPARATVRQRSGPVLTGGAVPSQSSWTTELQGTPERTYHVRTYGCQMNVHDSERLSGLLEAAGYTRRAGGGRRRRRRLQHLRGPGERRQPALRQPRPPAAGEGRPPRHADRRRRLPGAEGPRRDRPPRPVGRRRLRHAQRRLAAGAARAGPAQRRGAGGDRRVPRGLPVDAAGQARVGLRGLGVDQRRAATTPARSASSRRCAAGRRTAVPARSWPRCRRWSTRACSR